MLPPEKSQVLFAKKAFSVQKKAPKLVLLRTYELFSVKFCVPRKCIDSSQARAAIPTRQAIGKHAATASHSQSPLQQQLLHKW